MQGRREVGSDSEVLVIMEISFLLRSLCLKSFLAAVRLTHPAVALQWHRNIASVTGYLPDICRRTKNAWLKVCGPLWVPGADAAPPHPDASALPAPPVIPAVAA